MRSPLAGLSDPRRVGLVSVAHGLNEFYAIVLPPLFPLLVADLSISYAQAGTLLTVFFLMYAAFQLPAGLLADRVGKFRLVLAGIVVLGGGVLLMALAPDYRTLLAAQVVAGIGGSTYHPAGMSLISDLETGETEGRAMGFHGAVGTAGVALSPALLGGLTLVVDWRTALAVAGGVGLAAALVLRLAYDPPERTTEDAADLDAGAVTGTIRERLRSALRVPVTDQLLVLLLLHAFVSMLTRAVQTFTTSFVFAGGTGTLTGGNAAFVALLVGSGTASLWFGGLADRMNRHRLGVAVSLVTAALLGSTLFLPASVPLVALLPWFFVIGVATYSVTPVKNAIASAYSERGFSGGAFGLLQSASAVGSAVAPALFGFLADRWGVVAAYPAIGAVCALIAVCFLVLAVRGEPTPLPGFAGEV
ncbi:MAG: MFS transporter [Haloferacaceae archaeon]